jgi:hypothetical protein
MPTALVIANIWFAAAVISMGSRWVPLFCLVAGFIWFIFSIFEILKNYD